MVVMRSPSAESGEGGGGEGPVNRRGESSEDVVDQETVSVKIYCFGWEISDVMTTL